jgi:hypothetical protein
VTRPTRYHAAWRLASAAPKLYHGSREYFDPGFVLRPQEGGYASLPDEDIAPVEDIIEQHRPEGKIPRRESVFMVDDPERVEQAGGYADYIYIVEPIGPVEVSYLAWYGELSVFWMDMPEDERRRLAEGYWSGDPSPDRSLMKSRRLREYRARAAKVVAILD